MQRIVLPAALAAVFSTTMTGATVTLSTTCFNAGNAVTQSSASLATCAIGDNISATASLSAAPLAYTITANAGVSGVAGPTVVYADAKASLNADFTVTATVRPNSTPLRNYAVIQPCLKVNAVSDPQDLGSSGEATAVFGSVHLDAGPFGSETTCGTGTGAFQLAYGVPTTFHLSLSANAGGSNLQRGGSGGSGSASFSGVSVYDDSATQLTVAEIPEPSTAVLFAFGLSGLLIGAKRLRRS